jgi:hypothetical protein
LREEGDWHTMKKRIYIDLTEELLLKVQVLTAKTYLTPKDYQKVFDSLVDQSYSKIKK